MSEPLNPPPKQDPESLVLRANPQPVMRFRRPVLVGAVAMGCVAVFAVTWFGLTPSGSKVIETSEPSSAEKAAARPTAKPELLNALPATYDAVSSEVPVLGPPLPGDLGGPVYAHSRLAAGEPVASTQGRYSGAVEAKAPSDVFFRTMQRSGPDEPGEIPSVPATSLTGEISAVASPDLENPTVHAGTPQTGSVYNSHMVETPASPYQVMAGTVIAANLVTGLKSDLSGLVIAQVSAPVFDTVTGRILLIPQGTRLLGQYENDLSFGQSRVLVIWKRLIFPDGSSLEIDNFPASDTQGYTGLADRVDYHSRSLLKGVGLSTLLGLTSYDGRDDDSDLIRAFRDATRTTGNQAGQELVHRSLDVRPTVTVRSGWPVRVIVRKDLILRPYEGSATPWQN